MDKGLPPQKGTVRLVARTSGRKIGATVMCRAVASLLVLPLAACVSAQPIADALRPAAVLPGVAPAPQPRYASYDCGAAGSLTIENFQTSVLFVAPGGESAELPAAPPAQASSFRAAPYSVVLQGDEALYARTGRAPLRCRRPATFSRSID